MHCKASILVYFNEIREIQNRLLHALESSYNGAALSHSGATRLMLLSLLYFFLLFTGDFSETAEGISTKLSMETADGLE